MAKYTLPDQAYLRECFDYDPATGVLTWKHRPVEHFNSEQVRWNGRYAGTVAGHLNTYGSRWNGAHQQVTLGWDDGETTASRRRGRVKIIGAHRIIWKLVTGEDPPDEVDHRNRVGTDNRWENLRSVTRSENMRNTRGRKRVNHDLPQGVFPNGKNKWCAKIQHNGKLVYLGTYKSVDETHAAYVAAKKRLHGEGFQFKKDERV